MLIPNDIPANQKNEINCRMVVAFLTVGYTKNEIKMREFSGLCYKGFVKRMSYCHSFFLNKIKDEWEPIYALSV